MDGGPSAPASASASPPSSLSPLCCDKATQTDGEYDSEHFVGRSVSTMSPVARSSVEGLNQEIEGLALASSPDLRVTPEGHRAPLAEMLTRSKDTQTPAPPSSGGSVCSSPDIDANRLGTSPHINRFLAREPPDGCEKVNSKFTESRVAGTKTIGDLSPIKPSVGFQLRPSLGSAFQPLQPPIESRVSPDD